MKVSPVAFLTTSSLLVSSSSAFQVGLPTPLIAANNNVALTISSSTSTSTTLRQSSGSNDAVGSSPMAGLGQPTELPDSLEDGAQIAAQACADLIEAQGPMGRCRIDFDTSAGDETFTLLKQSTEFMQNLVTSLCYLKMPELQIQRQNEMMKVVNAQAELAQLQAKMEQQEESEAEADAAEEIEKKMKELQMIINSGGRDPDYQYEGPICRIYFPDEGNAALARRDWLKPKNGGAPLVPPCVQFSACGGMQRDDISNDQLVFFFCPKASEAESVEDILLKTETQASNLQLTVFVNPILVDMGVTGFGMAGRLLRERLIDPLPYAYYLRTLQWGALTRVWPRDFSVWQEDENADGGYRLIKTLQQLPSNPEVEDIYDIENGLRSEKEGGGFLDQFGDFVNGMMRL